MEARVQAEEPVEARVEARVEAWGRTMMRYAEPWKPAGGRPSKRGTRRMRSCAALSPHLSHTGRAAGRPHTHTVWHMVERRELAMELAVAVAVLLV